MRKVLCLLLVLTTCLSAAVLPAAANDGLTDSDLADVLYSMGLFQGTGTDAEGKPVYALERQASRTEALVMMLRLFGEEGSALAYTGENPFTDVQEWAVPYVAYAYSKGYTDGIGNGLFGATNPASENMYVTFVLRALGYSDFDGDFSYSSATDFAIENGIIDSSLRGKSLLTRGDCVRISYQALTAKCKGTQTSLIDRLAILGAVDIAGADASGLMDYDGGRQDMFQYSQCGNFSMGCNGVSDGENLYFVLKNKLEHDPDIAYADYVYDLCVFDSDFNKGEKIYTSELYGRITDLSIHDGKLYFFDGTPYSNGTRKLTASQRYFDFVEMDLETYETKVIYSTGYLTMMGWYDGVFYMEEDAAKGGTDVRRKERVIALDTKNGNKVSVLRKADGMNSIIYLAGANGEIYGLFTFEREEKPGTYQEWFAKWDPETGTAEKIIPMITCQIVGDDIYFTVDESENGIRDIYHAKLSDFENTRELICVLPGEGWRLNYYDGNLYSTTDANRTWVNGERKNVLYRIDLQTGEYDVYVVGFVLYDYNVLSHFVYSAYELVDPEITDLTTKTIELIETFINSRLQAE